MANLSLVPWRWDDSADARRQALCPATRNVPARVALSFACLCLAASASLAEQLTDSTGRTQDVAVPVAVVIPAGAPAQVLLQSIAPTKLGALVEGFAPEHVIYVDPKVATLPQVAMLTRSDAPGDVATVAALKPGLVVDYGSLSPRYVAADEKIAQELKVPAVLFAGDLSNAAGVIRALAKPLGETERGETLAKTVDQVLDRLKPLAALTDAERVPVYVARGGDGLTALRAGTSFDEPLRLAGARNVVTGAGGTFHHMSVDDVTKLLPAVVVFSDLGVLSSPLHSALPTTTRWVFDAGEPYKVLTGPPSINRLVGAAALAAILHPGKSGEDDPETIRRLETLLFPIPPGLAMPAPLQLQR